MNSTVPFNIQVNPDIIAIGVRPTHRLRPRRSITVNQVRLSLYILSLAGFLISLLTFSPSLLQTIENSLGITGFALFLSAVVFASERALDLFHALCIFRLVGLAGISVSAKPRRKRNGVQANGIRALYHTAVL